MGKFAVLKHFSLLAAGFFLLTFGRFVSALELPPALDLAVSDEIYLMAQQVRYWQEPEAVNITGLDQLPQQGWQPIGKDSINVGKSRTPVWFVFDVTNAGAERLDRILELRWINLNVADFYAQDMESGVVQTIFSGLRQQRTDTLSNSSWLFPFVLEQGQTKRIYLRLASRFNVMAPMFIWQADALEQHQTERYVWYGIAFGMLAALLLYNLSLYSFTRDSSYFYYSLYAGSIMLYEASLTGVGDMLLWGQIDWLRSNAFPFTIYSSFFVAALFIRNFLQLKSYGGWPLHVNTFFATYWLLSFFLLIFVSDNLAAVNELFALLSCIAALATSIYLWVKGNKSARYFTLAWGGLIALTFIAVLMMEGVLPYSPLTENGQLIGFVAEMLLLSFALAERINRERLEREVAQAAALDMQFRLNKERDEKLQAQESVLLIQQQTNQELEARVAQRTQELERTMTNLELANRELAKLSVTDPLTKVHNRRYFDETLAREMERSARTGQSISLILVDIDHFKQFNDRYGHLVGDDCLRLVASALSSVASRSTDLVARFGGEEFVIVLPDTTQQEAFPVAERIRNNISQLKFIYKGERIPISASLGIAGRVMQMGEQPQLLIDAADKALYQAKDQGRNRSVLADLAS